MNSILRHGKELTLNLTNVLFRLKKIIEGVLCGNDWNPDGIARGAWFVASPLDYYH